MKVVRTLDLAAMEPDSGVNFAPGITAGVRKQAAVARPGIRPTERRRTNA